MFHTLSITFKAIPAIKCINGPVEFGMRLAKLNRHCAGIVKIC